MYLCKGEGSCIIPAAYGEGKKLCLSFKSKGKCSKGDACLFTHTKREHNSEDNQHHQREKEPVEAKAKICFSFKSKGKCRKGSECEFQHATKADIVDKLPKTKARLEGNGESSDNKRVRIDGEVLVKKKKMNKDATAGII